MEQNNKQHQTSYWTHSTAAIYLTEHLTEPFSVNLTTIHIMHDFLIIMCEFLPRLVSLKYVMDYKTRNELTSQTGVQPEVPSLG